MSVDEGAEAGPGAGGALPGDAGAPGEEEMRERLEQEVRNLRVQDVLLQSVVSILNLSARRVLKEDERDLEQARIGIDAVRRVVDLLEGEPAKQVRDALAEVQMAFAREAGDSPGGAPAAGTTTAPGAPAAQERTERPPEPAERKRPPGLWTPPGA